MDLEVAIRIVNAILLAVGLVILTRNSYERWSVLSERLRAAVLVIWYLSAGVLFTSIERIYVEAPLRFSDGVFFGGAVFLIWFIQLPPNGSSDEPHTPR